MTEKSLSEDSELQLQTVLIEPSVIVEYDIYEGFNDKDVYLIKKIEKKRDNHRRLSERYNQNEGIFTKIFYIFGFLQVISTVVATALSGSGGITDVTDSISVTSFWVGLVTTILGTVTVFFKMEEKSSKHHISSGQYADMAEDLEADLDRDNDESCMKEYTTLYNEKEKFINGYEPNCSSSSLVSCLSGKIQKEEPILKKQTKEKVIYLENELLKELYQYKYMSALHGANDTLQGHLFTTFSAPQILLTVVMSIITGVGGFTNMSDNPYVLGAFSFSIIATILSAMRSIFKFQRTASLHHAASGQNADLGKDLKTKLRIGFDDRDDIQDTIDDAKEKKKFINSYAPPLTFPLRG